MDMFVIGIEEPEEELFMAYNHSLEIGGDFYIAYNEVEMETILSEARDSCGADADRTRVKLYKLVEVVGV